MLRIKLSYVSLLLVIPLCIVTISYSLFLFFFRTPQVPDSPTTLVSPQLIQAFEPSTSTTSWISPDGLFFLDISVVQDQAESKIYTIAVRPESSEELPRLIFTKTVDASSEYMVPYNTWSPDNKYFFLEEESNERSQIIVYSATEKSFKSGENSINITDLFSKKLPQFSLINVTGWASPTLLVVNASETSEMRDEVSFWFDITNQSFIRLSSNFNE